MDIELPKPEAEFCRFRVSPKMIPNFLISRLASPFKTPQHNHPQFQLGLLRHTHVFFFNSLAPQQHQHKKDHNFTISYLVTSCGLSPEAAVGASQKVHLESPDKPNAVLNLLRNYGFSETQIAKYIKKRPLLLLVNAEKTLLPKLKFFDSIGVSPVDLPKMALENQTLLARSLERFLIPRYKVLKSVVRDDREVVRALKRGAMAFEFCDVVKNLVPNTEFLRGFGVSQRSISHMVMFHPSEAFMKHEKFVKGVKLAWEMGFDPLKTNFISAVHVLLHLDKAKMESRFEALEKWGWSREVSLSAFRKFPTFMSYSEERIGRSMSFLVEDMGWPSEDIARFPAALAYSLEKRIIPRCHVIKILKSKGLVDSQLSLATFMCAREEVFLETYVTKFRKDVPRLLKVYQGLIDYKDVL